MAVETIIKADPFASANGKVIAVPFQFLSTGEEHLRVRSFNSLVGVVLSIDLRTLTGSGDVQVHSFTHTPNSNRTVKVTTIPLSQGYILTLVVRAQSGSPLIGQTYVIVELVRGVTANAAVLGQVLGGYVTSQQGLAFPGSPIESSTAGQGFDRILNSTTPAAGAEIAAAVPTGARWEPYVVRFDFQASGVIADRYSRLRYLSAAGDLIGWHQALAKVTAGALSISVWQRGPVAGISDPAPVLAGSLAEGIRLTAGAVISTNTLFMQAADQYGSVVIGVREWLEAA